METQAFGQTDQRVTRLGVGLAALGRPGYINVGHADDMPATYDIDAMRDQAQRVLDSAWAAGVRYFDTARSYGRGEAFLASWLDSRNIDATDVTVGSKWGYTYTADWQVDLPAGVKHEVKEHTRDVLDRQIEESRSILADHLHIYHIHSATKESGVLRNKPVLTRLAELRDAGIIIGFSTSGPQQAETIRAGLAIEFGGRPLFQSIQATWNVLEQSAGQALVEAQQAGCGIIVKEALANGRLTDRNGDPVFRSRHERLFQAAESQGVTIDAVAIACALRRPWASVVLSGAATVDHLASNLAAAKLTDQPQLDELLDLGEPTAEYWATRSELSWN